METKKQMIRQVQLYSLFIMLVAVLISLFLKDKSITIGIVIGTLTGLIGFNMIVSMAYRIEKEGGAKQAVFNYLLRYILYGCIFALGYMAGANLIALLVGFLCHKLALLIYSKKAERR